MTRQIRSYALTIAALCVPLSTLSAQPQRIVKGSVSPLVHPRFDRGRVASDMSMGEMSIALSRSAEQQAALDDLLAKQQNPASPSYHRWLTAEQFADRFGASPAAVAKVVEWLEAQGFTVTRTARGRDYINFTGNAGRVEAALRTEIHHYSIDGVLHYANADEPSLPEHLAPLVSGVRGLDSFRPRSPRRPSPFRGIPVGDSKPRPEFFSRSFPDTNVLAPDDLATIYNVNALYRAGIDGTGQTIAVIGQSDIDLSDVRIFREIFGLPANDPVKVLVPGARNPGKNDAEGEANLDLEWSGSIARNATLLYVFSGNAFDAAFHAIDENLAPVMTFSFGLCERNISSRNMAIIAAEAQKAAAMGITWVASSGDSGAASCEDHNGRPTAATTRLSVNVPSNIPEVTGVGGTEFNEGNGLHFAARPDQNFASAFAYIPETSWNDSALISRNRLTGFAASGGGASLFFGKPSWQKGLGVPDDGARNVPDVSLTASWFHDPYALITGGDFFPSGGTSASAPVFAGIVALLNQKLVAEGVQAQPGLGNINPMLYKLAQDAPGAFHDITAGSNIVSCVVRSSADCTTGTMGFNAGTGYDLVTGLGSVDAFNLVLDWTAQVSRTPRLAVTEFTASTTARAGGSFTMSATVANQGTAAAGAFQIRVYFTTNGDVATALPYYLFCDVKGLDAGASTTCGGTLNLGAAVTPGAYRLLAVADAENAVSQPDRSAATALANLTVTR